MKEQTLVEMKNKIEAMTRVIDFLLQEVENTKTMVIGHHQLLKQFPDYEEAEKQLIQSIAEKEVENVE